MKPHVLYAVGARSRSPCAPPPPPADPDPVGPPVPGPRSRPRHARLDPAAPLCPRRARRRPTASPRPRDSLRHRPAPVERSCSPAPAQPVVVAVRRRTDTRTWTLREPLAHAMEIAGNGRDDDGNGYVDDVHGWLHRRRVGRVPHDTFEVTRLYSQCVPRRRATRCPRPCATIARRSSPTTTAAAPRREHTAADRLIGEALGRATTVLKREAGTDSLTTAQVRAMLPRSGDARQARTLYLQLAATGSPRRARGGARGLQGQRATASTRRTIRATSSARVRQRRARDYGNRNVRAGRDHARNVAASSARCATRSAWTASPAVRL